MFVLPLPPVLPFGIDLSFGAVGFIVLASLLFFVAQLASVLDHSKSTTASLSLTPPAPQPQPKPPRNRTRARGKGKHARQSPKLSTPVSPPVSKSAPPRLPPLSIPLSPIKPHASSKLGHLPFIDSEPSSPTESLADTLVEEQPPKVKQPLDAFLVVDVEATCSQGVGFDYPNEIIEWPVVLLRWAERDECGRASQLVPVAEFRSFVRPTWRPQISDFCTALTGITQTDVDPAPTWPELLENGFRDFLADNGLIDRETGARLERFVFCSDGPFDVRDFVVKQCFISQIPIPEYLRGDILDTRKAVTALVANRDILRDMPSTATAAPNRPHMTKRMSLNIPMQLHALGMGPFMGRPHCGIDDARNIARILTELGRQPMRLEPNTYIHPHRKWWWMGTDGQVLFP